MLNYILLVSMTAISIVGLVLALRSEPGSAQRFFVAVATVVALSIAVAMVVVLFPSIFTIDRLAISAVVLLSLIATISLVAGIATSRRDAPAVKASQSTSREGDAAEETAGIGGIFGSRTEG